MQRDRRILARPRRRQRFDHHARSPACPSCRRGPLLHRQELGAEPQFSQYDHSPARERAESLGAFTIDLPELSPVVMQKVDQTDASFWAAAHNPSFATSAFTRLDRQRLKVWLQTSFDNFTRSGAIL